MKRCSQCNQTYNDDNLNYCLADGTPLTTESEATIVIERSPPPKKKGPILWLVLIGLVVLVGVTTIAGLFIYSRQGSVVKLNAVSATPTPKPPPTAKPTHTPAPGTPVEEPAPPTAGSKTTPDNEDADDVTPIAWDTTANGFKGEAGQTYKFECPEDGTAQAVYGSDIYTDYSSICTAAVHAGLISLEDGGVVTIEYRPGRAIYGSTVRNGIKSNTAGDYARSFVVR